MWRPGNSVITSVRHDVIGHEASLKQLNPIAEPWTTRWLLRKADNGVSDAPGPGWSPRAPRCSRRNIPGSLAGPHPPHRLPMQQPRPPPMRRLANASLVPPPCPALAPHVTASRTNDLVLATMHLWSLGVKQPSTLASKHLQRLELQRAGEVRATVATTRCRHASWPEPPPTPPSRRGRRLATLATAQRVHGVVRHWPESRYPSPIAAVNTPMMPICAAPSRRCGGVRSRCSVLGRAFGDTAAIWRRRRRLGTRHRALADRSPSAQHGRGGSEGGQRCPTEQLAPIKDWRSPS